MKKYLFLTLFFIIGNTVFAQSNSSKCKCNVTDVTKVVSFGYLVGYNAIFKNTSTKTIDGVYWTEVYYNNAGDVIKQTTDSFNSISLIDPIQSGFSRNIVRSPRVKGASKVILQIDKVHFTDGTTCQ